MTDKKIIEGSKEDYLSRFKLIEQHGYKSTQLIKNDMSLEDLKIIYGETIERMQFQIFVQNFLVDIKFVSLFNPSIYDEMFKLFALALILCNVKQNRT